MYCDLITVHNNFFAFQMVLVHCVHSTLVVRRHVADLSALSHDLPVPELHR
jgi:hypothetical protein